MLRVLLACLALLVSTLVSGPAAAQIMITQNPVNIQDQLQINVPNSGDTVTSNNGTTVLILNHSVLILALTIQVPQNPSDGQRWMVTSGAAITTLTMTGGTVKGALTGISINGYARYIYSASAGA